MKIDPKDVEIARQAINSVKMEGFNLTEEDCHRVFLYATGQITYEEAIDPILSKYC